MRQARTTTLLLRVELERESADRWIADVVTLPGVMVHGSTKGEALQAVQAPRAA